MVHIFVCYNGSTRSIHHCVWFGPVLLDVQIQHATKKLTFTQHFRRDVFVFIKTHRFHSHNETCWRAYFWLWYERWYQCIINRIDMCGICLSHHPNRQYLRIFPLVIIPSVVKHIWPSEAYVPLNLLNSPSHNEPLNKPSV